MHVALRANITAAQENSISLSGRDHFFFLSLLNAAVGALNGTSEERGEQSTLQRLSMLSSSGRKCHVERIVASRVHGMRIGQMERERLGRPRVRA